MKYRNARIAAIAALALMAIGYSLRDGVVGGDRAKDERKPRPDTFDPEAKAAPFAAPIDAVSIPKPKESFQVLKNNALAGDTKAMRELRWRYDECYFHNARINVSARNLDRLAHAKPQFRSQAEWIKRYRRVRCVDVEGGLPYNTVTAHQWSQRLLERGDPTGELMVGTIAEGKTDPETLRKLQSIVERQKIAKDPEVAYMLSLVNPEQGSSLSDEDQPLFQNNLTSQAWQVAACRAGYDSGCSWGSRIMNQNCEFQSLCQYMSLEQLVLDLHVPPGRRTEFLETVRSIQSRFL
jgi:hypothetical protein